MMSSTNKMNYIKQILHIHAKNNKKYPFWFNPKMREGKKIRYVPTEKILKAETECDAVITKCCYSLYVIYKSCFHPYKLILYL